MAAISHSYRYGIPSRLESSDGRSALHLATSGIGDDPDARPHFFDGRLVAPRRAGDLLLAVSRIVASRFHMPPAMLQRQILLSDPVVTSSREMLRFEGFSSCCGVYARADLLPDAVEVEHRATGTTNVDFNEAMRAALSGLKNRQAASLAVGEDEVVLRSDGGEVVEKKVELPRRWIRGFAETQALQSSLECRFELAGVAVTRFLRSLPKGAKQGWIVGHGGSLRLSQVARDESVFVAGIDRLKVLERPVQLPHPFEMFRQEYMCLNILRFPCDHPLPVPGGLLFEA